MDEGHELRLKNHPSCSDYTEDYWFDYETIRSSVFQETEGTLKARYICAECPALQECLDYAVKYENLDGIWGGTDSIQRRAMRKAQGINAIDFKYSYPNLIRVFQGREYASTDE